jgi:CubicO group peptidase (beta-lactamase class C family)
MAAAFIFRFSCFPASMIRRGGVRMQRLAKWCARLAIALVGTAIIAAGLILIFPPDLLRVGTGYAAKIICSNVFVAGRDADDVLRDDVQAPGHPLLRLVHADVHLEQGLVRTSLLGMIAPSAAVHREGLGCAAVSEPQIETAKGLSAPPAEAVPADINLAWPEGEGVQAYDPRLKAILADSQLIGPAARGVVVVKDGRIIGEAYGPGLNENTPLLGWSMTKTVTAALVGMLADEGRLDLDASDLFPEWSNDRRRDIKLSDLLAMESGLLFNESYGDVTDVTRMLYLEGDMAGYVTSLPADAAPGTRFNYSSGETVLISRYWMSHFDEQAQALAYPRQALFDTLGMRSAVLEADAVGTFVGASYLYATARDWARFGLLLANNGRWDGRQVIGASFMSRISRPTDASAGDYTEAQAWQNGPEDQDANYGLPADTLWMLGHDGQSIAIIPSESLVVVRLGLTPRKLDYRPQRLVQAVREALR